MNREASEPHPTGTCVASVRIDGRLVRFSVTCSVSTTSVPFASLAIGPGTTLTKWRAILLHQTSTGRCLRNANKQRQTSGLRVGVDGARERQMALTVV